jgi:hypothetical protein
VVKNGHQKGTHYDEIGLCAQKTNTNLSSLTIHNREGLCDFFHRHRIFILVYIALVSQLWFLTQDDDTYVRFTMAKCSNDQNCL